LALAAGLLLGLGALPCLAQEGLPPAEEAPEPQAVHAAKPQGGDSVGGRLGRLEDKVQGLQISIGTLESFLRNKPGTMLPQEAPAPVVQGPPQGDLGPRIDALETQIGALTSHLEQLTRKLGALEAKLASAPAPIAPPMQQPVPERQGEAPPPPSQPDYAAADAPPRDDGTPDMGWNPPKPDGDSMAEFLERQDSAAPPPVPDDQPRSLMAALPGADPQTLYQQGYGALLQKDYVGAEGAFGQLVKTYPNDPLAGSAQYWIGESYYARGQYKNAADAFLKGYRKYKSGEKAPDTLLKLGMSLAELGQKDAACSTFSELKAKYPDAPDHIRNEASAQRKHAGC
jgi:tol-pal system protein YbgF